MFNGVKYYLLCQYFRYVRCVAKYSVPDVSKELNSPVLKHRKIQELILHPHLGHTVFKKLANSISFSYRQPLFIFLILQK